MSEIVILHNSKDEEFHSLVWWFYDNSNYCWYTEKEPFKRVENQFSTHTYNYFKAKYEVCVDLKNGVDFV